MIVDCTIRTLPSEVNVGYVEFEDSIVDTVDGQAVASLSHMVGLLSSRDGESHRILLEDTECEIVLRHEDVDRRTQEILARYRIPADRSPNVRTRHAFMCKPRTLSDSPRNGTFSCAANTMATVFVHNKHSVYDRCEDEL